MKKIIILMPVYNDWESLNKLMIEINKVVQNLSGYNFQCVVINDCSTVERSKIDKPKNLVSLRIVNMKKNQGHARCNATGLRYINSNINYDYVIVMDSDGEDRPIEIKDLVNEISKNPSVSVVAKRVKRSEGFIFQSLYQLHKLITYIFTGKIINFGNYSCLTKKDVNILSNSASLWSSFSGTLKKNLPNYSEVDSIRGSRYFGPSKMSLLNLIIHSFSIISVFKYTVFLRSAFMIIALSFLTNAIGLVALIFQVLIVFFSLLIFLISKRENEKELIKSNENILNDNDMLH